MSIPSFGGQRAGDHNHHTGRPRRKHTILGRWARGRRRQWMLVSLCSFGMALTLVALPLALAHADANSLGTYSATASGWSIKTYAVNDKFLNVPLDQTAPLVFVSMDNNAVSPPNSQAKAAYFFPGTAANAVPSSQGVNPNIPTGVEADYPGSVSSGSGQVGSFNDGIATQSSGGSQAAQASDGYALAQATLGSVQFAPTIPTAPSAPGVPAVPGAPGVPALPSPPALPTASSGGSGSGAGGAPAPTSTTGGGQPAPTATTCSIFGILGCPTGSTGPSHGGVNAAPANAPAPLPPATLPDPIEQALTAALNAAQSGNLTLMSLAGGKLATPNPSLPLASADASGQAETRATDNGVSVIVDTRAQKVELFQGLITFASVESVLKGVAPGNGAQGSGTVTTIITGATIGGIPVTIDANGVHVQDQNASAAQAQSLTDQLNAALKQANVQVSLIRTTASGTAGMWQASGTGVEVMALLAPPSTSGVPSVSSVPGSSNLPGGGSVPTGAVPSTHIDFTIADGSANIAATPAGAAGAGDNGGSGSSGGGDNGGGFNFGFFGGGGDSSTTTTNGSTSPGAKHTVGAFQLPLGLHGLPLLALVFVIQGLSTAAVAATAGYTDKDDPQQQPNAEEETK